MILRLMVLGHAKEDGWCPDCAVWSLVRMVFATYERNRPVGIVRTIPYCADCLRVFD